MKRPRWLRSLTLTPWLLAGVCGCSSVLGLDDVLLVDDADASADGGAGSSGATSSSGASSGESSSSGGTSSGGTSSGGTSSGAVPPLAWAPVSVAVASQHACALQANGQVRCWLLVQSASYQVAPPVQVGNTVLQAKTLVARGTGFCADPKVDGPLICWDGLGDNAEARAVRADGQPFGANNQLVTPPAPVGPWELCTSEAQGGDTTVQCTPGPDNPATYVFRGLRAHQIVVGNDVVCARGNGNSACQRRSASPQSLPAFADLALSPTEVCGVTTTGLSCALHANQTTPILTPIQGLAQVALGTDFTCVRLVSNDDSSVRCVRNQQRADLAGARTLELQSGRVEHLAAGSSYACAVTQRRVFCWDARAFTGTGDTPPEEVIVND